MSDKKCNVDDLRALKHLFVQQVLEDRRKYDSEIEVICAVAPDAAVMRLKADGELVANGNALFEHAENALRELAFKLDVDGSIEHQMNVDPSFCVAEDQRAVALDSLRRFASEWNGPLTHEAAEERDAALHVLVPTLSARDRRAKG